MNILPSRKFRALLSLLGTAGLLTATAFGQSAATTTTTTTAEEKATKLEKFVVTGSFIEQPSGEAVAPVAVLTNIEIRALGSITPTQALRTMPSFVSSAGTNGSTEMDSNGGNGSAYVSLRGLGSDYTLTLVDGRPAGNFANLNLLPIEAISRIEVLRDGAGVIYGPSAIGGAVNVILKKNFTGTSFDVMGGAATRSPGARETYQASFSSGLSNDGTSVVVAGSVFKNRTIYASQRPNSANPDARAKGGINGGSPTYASVIADGAGNPLILKPGFSASATPTAADYIVMDQNGFSSNQLFNFRQYSPSAPGQERQSIYASIEQQIVGKSLVVFGDVMHSKLGTANGLAPAPFALDADPAGPAVGSLTSYGPYAPAGQSLAFFRYRSVEIGNRTENQTFDDNRVVAGVRGELFDKWKWEAAMTYDDETFTEIDGGVPSLPLLDVQVASGAFNPFAQAFSKGTATIGGKAYTWDNAKALKASLAEARWVGSTHNRDYLARASGPVFQLPAGDLQAAGGIEFLDSGYQEHNDDLYFSGSVLGLPSRSNDHRETYQRALFGEIKVPLLSDKDNIPFVHDLSFGALARNEEQTLKGSNNGVWTQRKFKKTNPNMSLRYSPNDSILVRSTWSKGFLTPSTTQLFTTIAGDTPTLVDPLGFPYTTQTSIQIRGNPNLQAAISKAWSAGIVIEPKQFVKGLSFSVDYYNLAVSNIVANNAQQILAANAAGQGAGFVAGNAATINPNAPFASQIRRSANGRLNTTGAFVDYPGSRGAVLSDYLNIGSRDVEGLEYSVTYVFSTSELGQFRTTLATNQFLKFTQKAGPTLPEVNFLGRMVSTVGDRTSPGSVPRWKGNVVTQWTFKNFTTNLGLNYIDSYQDDPLFVLSPKMQAYYNAGTPKSDAAFSTFLGDTAQLKVGGYRRIAAFTSFDLQTTYAFKNENRYLKGLSVTLGATNLFDKLAPFSAGAFNDNYDTRTVSNVGRFVYSSIHKQF